MQAIFKSAKTMRDKLIKIESALTQNKYETPSDRLRHPTMLKEKMEALVSVVSIADTAPPSQANEVFNHLVNQINEKLST